MIAATHLLITPEHVREAGYLALLFSLLSAVMIGVGAGLLRQDALWQWGAGALACLGAIAGYLISRTIGLPLAQDDVGRWADPAGLVALAAESGFVLFALATLRRALSPARPPSPGPDPDRVAADRRSRRR